MLYTNMLALSLLQLSYFLIAPLAALGAVLVNTTLNATPSDELDTPSPVCVENTQHPTWGVSLDQFDVSLCQHAVELITSKLAGDLYMSYDFYSRQVYPSGPGPPGHLAWPLAQGAGAG